MLDHFGFLAPFYERFIQPSFPATLSELLDLPEGGTLLDVGGGTGRLAQFFTSRKTKVFLVDLSYRMLAESRQKDLLIPACSHSEFLPFPAESFDRIIMVDAFHHVCDQERTVQEMWRVIKPGGRVVIEEPDIHHPIVKLVALAEKLALMRSHFLNGEQILALFDGYGGNLDLHQEGHNLWAVVKKPQRADPEPSNEITG